MRRLLTLAFIVLLPAAALADCAVELRPYGIAATFNFCLRNDEGAYPGSQFKVDAVCATGDVRIMSNEGTEANNEACFVDRGTCYSVAVTAARMAAQRVLISINDQGTPDYDAYCIAVSTYGYDGVAQAGGTKTITLAATASSVNRFYEGQFVKITAGTGVGQTRRIVSYVGATRVATVNEAWVTVPDSTSVYELGGNANVKVDAYSPRRDVN